MTVYMSMGEAHRRLSEYVNEFTEAIASQNGSALQPLLAISSNSPYRESVASAIQVFKDISRVVKQVDKYAQLGDMLQQHIRCMQSFQSQHYVDAYYALEKSANAFLQEFRNWETAWAVDALYTIVYEMRTLAEMGKGPKRLGALYVTCQLFKVYFKLGTVHLCRSVIRSIETARVFEFEEFPTRDKVTYMYYTGRLEVFNDNFLAADQKLMYALEHCDPRKEANIRMILKYLIPVKLSLGILPKEWLLQKYNLLEYIDVVRALRRGDLRLLRHALQNHEDEFLRAGVYLVLEKLELQVYQRLIKKIYIIQKQKDASKAHQVKMDIIVKALKWLEIDVDIEEVECIMAILIHKNLMKGYFSHKSKVVVLSKQDAFPKLSGRPVNA